jgi:POT family proton-dependent oligopeptide transporter
LSQSTAVPAPGSTTFGHPHGLFVLVFAELWERFSYYGMRALLVLYMMKGFLQYEEWHAKTVYGAYTALVYMTPFFGGLLADRLLGARRAVILGGLLMAAGHLLMTVQQPTWFYLALGLLIAGNGFFKPNISTMVGRLYPAGSHKRDGAFTIFYMGVNLGAALAPLLCGYVGETVGWHYGFGLATIGMLSGLAMFVAPTLPTQLLILGSALASAWGLWRYKPDNPLSIGLNFTIGAALVVAGFIAWRAIGRGGVPEDAGAPPDRERLAQRGALGLRRDLSVYLLALVAVPVIALFVSGFSTFTEDGKPVKLVSEELVAGMKDDPGRLVQIAAVVVEEISRPAGLLLLVGGIGAALWVLVESLRLPRIARQRMFVVMTLTFFSVMFWAFFEQAGSSLNLFADRNIQRVNAERAVTADMVGQVLRIQPTQAQVGFHDGETLFTLTRLDELRAAHEKDPAFEVDWTVAPDNVGMVLAERKDETPASTYQAFNAAFILAFGLLLTMLWAWLDARGWEPSTPAKFALGILQVGLGFGAFWWGAQQHDARGLVALSWLVWGYLLHTTGELCLSPVGLSMVSKLAPRRMVSTVMGTWFLAIAFAQYLAAIISQFTGTSSSGDGAAAVPLDTVASYGDVFGNIALTAIGTSLVVFALVPLLKKWMHEDQPAEGAPAAGH